MKGPSPLLGYNTNVRHSGKLYHLQTEDSGLKHPHVITHLFADGGRIIATTKTSYAEHVGAEEYRDIVKQMMRDQHKAMYIALRDGVYDEDGDDKAPEVAEDEESMPALDVDALEAAAARMSRPERPRSSPPPGAGRYQVTAPAEETLSAPPVSANDSIFGGDLLSEKSLDEVILSYLSEDLEEGPE